MSHTSCEIQNLLHICPDIQHHCAIGGHLIINSPPSWGQEFFSGAEFCITCGCSKVQSNLHWFCIIVCMDVNVLTVLTIVRKLADTLWRLGEKIVNEFWKMWSLKVFCANAMKSDPQINPHCLNWEICQFYIEKSFSKLIKTVSGD